MKNNSKKIIVGLFNSGVVAVALLMTGSSAARADIVYNNSTNRNSPDSFLQSGSEFGDEVVLNGSANRYLTNFSFEYFGFNFSGNEQLRFRIYRNDGVAYGTNNNGSTFYAPGTMLYDSGAFAIGATAGSTVDFNTANGTGFGVPVPSNFTWSVEFSGVTGGETAGLALYDVPTVGSDFAEYWDHSGTGGAWDYRASGSTHINFGAVIAAAGVVVDVTPPTLKLSTKAGAKFYSGNFTSTASIAGSAKDNLKNGVIVLYKATVGASYKPATQVGGSYASWTAVIPMAYGTNNPIYLKGIDGAGNEAMLSSAFTLAVTNPLTLNIVGSGTGTVAPSLNGNLLEVGKLYTIAATPTGNSLFSNYVTPTSILSANAKATFAMTSNMVINAQFVTNRFLDAAGSYNGLFYQMAGVDHASAGFITIKVVAPATKLATFGGKLSVEGETVGYAGTFGLTGDGENFKAVTRNGRTDIKVRLHIAFDGSDTISGSVSNTDGSWVSPIKADLNKWSLANPATAYVSNYTMVMPGDLISSASRPGGYGWATVSISSLGTVVAIGNLADGEAFKSVVPLSKDGLWPLYNGANGYVASPKPVKQFAGSILGWIAVDKSQVADELHGSLSWNKENLIPADPRYPSGFSVDPVVVQSSIYTAPGVGVRMIDLTAGAGTSTVSLGNIVSPLVNSVIWNTINKVAVGSPNPQIVSYSPTPKSGAVKGGVKNLALTLSGAVLQEQNAAYGFFKGTTETGKFSIVP